jgi:hypothetical protein
VQEPRGQLSGERHARGGAGRRRLSALVAASAMALGVLVAPTTAFAAVTPEVVPTVTVTNVSVTTAVESIEVEFDYAATQTASSIVVTINGDFVTTIEDSSAGGSFEDTYRAQAGTALVEIARVHEPAEPGGDGVIEQAYYGTVAVPGPPEPTWPLFKNAYSGTIYELVNNRTPTPLTFERWRDVYRYKAPQATPTNYVKYPWSPTLYAVTFWPGGEPAWQWDRLGYDQWRTAGFPAPRNAGWIPGSYYYKWATSPELFVEGEDGVNHKLTAKEWRDSGYRSFVDRGNEGFMKLSWTSDIVRMTNIGAGHGYRIGLAEWREEAYPSPQVRKRIPGDQFYQYAGQATVWYAGPAMNRPVTYAEWKAAGSPQPAIRSPRFDGDAGVLRVGADVEPGTYRSTGNKDYCYWARLSGLNGSLDNIIDNFIGNGSAYVTIEPSDVAFETNRCNDWVKVG